MFGDGSSLPCHCPAPDHTETLSIKLTEEGASLLRAQYNNNDDDHGDGVVSRLVVLHFPSQEECGEWADFIAPTTTTK